MTTPVAPAPVPPVLKPVKPVKPAKPAKPTAPAPKPAMVTRTFQVDRYLPVTVAHAKAVAGFDDDRRLSYREDKALWGASRHQIVTVRVPRHATPAQVIAAINAKTTSAVGDVRTTAKLTTAKPRAAYVKAWELGRGATVKAPWGSKNRIAQIFFARS